MQVYEFNVPTFGKGVVFDVDHKVRAEQFKFFAEALKSAKLKLYVPHFVQEAQVGLHTAYKQACYILYEALVGSTGQIMLHLGRDAKFEDLCCRTTSPSGEMRAWWTSPRSSLISSS